MIGFIPPNSRKEDIKTRLQNITQQLESHIGHYALLKEKEGRSVVVYLIRLLSHNKGEYTCYDATGSVRCKVTKYLNVVDILTNVQQLVFLEM